MGVKISKYFGKETKFTCSNKFDEQRVQTLMGEVVQTQQIIRLYNSETLFYDVGAAVGTMGLHIAHFARKVVLIEPDPAHAKLLRENISINNFSNTVMFEVGVGNFEGNATLHTDGKTNGICPSCKGGLGHKGSISIDICTLDSLFEKTGVPDILKMDIEGYELEALLGMNKSPKYLFIEIHPHHAENLSLANDIKDLLSSRYRQSYLYNRKTELLSKWELL